MDASGGRATRAALRRVPVGDPRGEGAPRLAGRDAPARHRRLRPRADRPVARRRVRRRARGRPPHQPAASRTAATSPGRQRLRRARSRACSRSSTRVRARCSRSLDLGVVPVPDERGAYLPERRRHRARRACDRSRSPSPRGRASPSTATSCAGSAGRSASASTRTRAWCSTRSRTTIPIRSPARSESGRCCTARRCARWSCPTAIPTPMHGWKNAFDAGEWGLGRMANSLREGCDCLGRDPLPRRDPRDRAGRPVHRRARDLPPRGGLRDPLEAPRPARRHRARCGAPVAWS